jgi:hypothetical protein
MVYVWIGLAVVLLVAGLFLITQGGSQIGGSLALLAVVIGLILAICPARAQAFSGADNCQTGRCADQYHDGYHIEHSLSWAVALP